MESIFQRFIRLGNVLGQNETDGDNKTSETRKKPGKKNPRKASKISFRCENSFCQCRIRKIHAPIFLLTNLLFSKQNFICKKAFHDA